MSTDACLGVLFKYSGQGTLARFNAPNRFTVDRVGNIVLSDEDNLALRKVAKAGTRRHLAGNGQRGFQDGLGAVARFGGPGAWC